jgi:hypothetical protein
VVSATSRLARIHRSINFPRSGRPQAGSSAGMAGRGFRLQKKPQQKARAFGCGSWGAEGAIDARTRRQSAVRRPVRSNDPRECSRPRLMRIPNSRNLPVVCTLSSGLKPTGPQLTGPQDMLDFNAELESAESRISELQKSIALQMRVLRQLSDRGMDKTLGKRMLDFRHHYLRRAIVHAGLIESRIVGRSNSIELENNLA